jgi:hypothetical protein
VTSNLANTGDLDVGVFGPQYRPYRIEVGEGYVEADLDGHGETLEDSLERAIVRLSLTRHGHLSR